MTSLAPLSWTACVSALRLDRLAMGELPQAEAAELRAHLSSCAACAGAAQRLEADREQTVLPPLRLVDAPVVALRPRRAARFAAAGVGLAAAASVAIALLPRPPEERSKGPAQSLGMYVQHQGQVRRGGAGEVVSPGDDLRFTATAQRDGFIAVLSLDARGVATIYFPQAERAAPLPAGRDAPLPASTRLDDSVGEEQIVGLFCSAPVELEPVRRSLAARDLHLPDGCQVTRWSFVKR